MKLSRAHARGEISLLRGAAGRALPREHPMAVGGQGDGGGSRWSRPPNRAPTYHCLAREPQHMWFHRGVMRSDCNHSRRFGHSSGGRALPRQFRSSLFGQGVANFARVFPGDEGRISLWHRGLAMGSQRDDAKG